MSTEKITNPLMLYTSRFYRRDIKRGLKEIAARREAVARAECIEAELQRQFARRREENAKEEAALADE